MVMVCIEDIKACCSKDGIILTDHLMTRMRQRNIRLKDIKHTLAKGEIIEQYVSVKTTASTIS